ncbi:MAG TPA: AarF/UbiB family protein [Thermoanaerobaculia bacterium]|nr:AarF/UbiB family protein [Thermoanaerobaculia bacterium]
MIAEAIDRSRYRRLRRFLARLFAHLVWFDLVLNQPLLRRFRSEPRARWTALAREYRSLAVELGGVLIKLGQYLSTRVDVLPVEITRELSGLQDQVPAVPFPEIARRIEQDFGRPAAELFGRIDPEPAGAASLAQAHRATLPGGEAVVVKVLRPGIERLVETDLAAIGLAIRWLRPWRRIRRRVDFDRLFDEFARTTRAELDMEREAAYAERFAEIFRDDPGILVPAVHRKLTARHTLTLEDVGYLRIGDLEAIAAAGVSLPEVARRLYRAYMEQLFFHHFVHCDPHPGNLFIRPLDEGAPEAPPEAGPEAGRPFQIAFVDFGMMSAIPEHLWEALAEVVIAAGTRDARRLVRAYRDAGILLPEADLARLEEIHRDLFQRFWGLKLSELQGVAQAQAPHLIWQYRDVVYQAPVQFPVDLLFTFRALGILTGMATTLDPEFDPWAATLPFAEELAKEGLGEAARRSLGELTAAGAVLLRLPAGLERAVALAEGAGLRVRAELSDDARRALRRIERTGGRVAWTVAAAALLLAGIEVELARPGAGAALGLWIAAGAAFLWGLVRR